MKGLEIKELRKKLGYTQEEFAEKLGVNRRTVLNWENGETITKSVEKLILSYFGDENERGLTPEASVGTVLNAINKLSAIVRNDNDASIRKMI